MASSPTARRRATLPAFRASVFAFVFLVLALSLVASAQSPKEASHPSRKESPGGSSKREAAPAPPVGITPVTPVPFGSVPDAAPPPPARDDVLTVKKIPTSNLVLDPLPSSTGDTVTALIKWSNDSTAGANWNLCSSRTIFDNTTANLACKFFGYPGGGFRVNSSSALPSEKPFLVSLPLFSCLPNVTSFKDCTAGDLIRGAACPETDIIVLKCYGEGSLRLVGGSTDSQGRLQMFWDGAWNNVCSSNIVNTTANTACALMGFPTNNAQRVKSANFDPRSTRYNEPHLWVPYVSCNGGEPSFKRCFSDRAPYRLADGTSKCYPTGADAALVCNPAKSSAARPAAASALYASVLLAVLYVLAF